MKKTLLYILLFTLSSNLLAQESKNADDWVIQPIFDYAGPFSEGFAVVGNNGKFGFINEKGYFSTECIFEDARDFKEGFAAVKNKGKWGFINKKGQRIIAFQYDRVDDYYYGRAYVTIGTTYKAFINTIGGVICTDVVNKDSFEYLSKLMAQKSIDANSSFSRLITVKENGKWGYKKCSLNNFINNNLPSWDAYLSSRLNKPDTFDENYLKKKIEPEINKWQQKGEFEPTIKWQERVNEETRKKKIDELTLQYKTEYENNVLFYQKRYAELVEEYKQNYDNLRDKYYNIISQEKKREFATSAFELRTYDADNQSFLITSKDQGDILISVPLKDAPSFKKNWNAIKNTITPVYTPSGDDVVLTSLTMTNDGKEYVYNSQTQAKYAVTDIDYNFAPIEVAMPDIANVNYTFDPVDVIQSSIVQTTPVTKGLENNAKIDYVSLNATNRSEIDTNIPTIKHQNEKTFAVIITNEQYIREVKVPYAINDGKTFADYCKLSLGIPQKQIHLVENATLNDMKYHINWLKQVLSVTDGEAKVIFYYAGHGIPNEAQKTAYILPVDGYGSDVSTGYSLNELYTALGTLPSQSVTVFLDACFSGTKREGGMLTAARGVAIKVKPNEPKGKMVVLSAAQGDETAYPYKEMGHGMFTYYLLKKLQETKGDVSIGELSTYIIENVRRQSVVLNGKVQTPTVSFSTSLGDTWKEWKLR